jgi:N-acyl-L-homoserine lactone synthetase
METPVEVLVIDAVNYAAHADALAQMHRQRRRLFVETLGWRGLDGADGGEKDRFDGPAATYLLAIDGDGAVRGSLRLLPTIGPHLLADVFPHFVDGPVPRGPSLMEWTRHAPGLPDWPPAVNAAARLALHLGVLEYARRHGVTGFTALMETWLLRRARAMGWDCAPLGAPQGYGEGEAVAVLNPVRAGHLEMLRERAGRRAPVLADAVRAA